MAPEGQPVATIPGNSPSAAKSLGMAACTAIVVGNMVGSGFYLSPSALAPYGLLAILAWIVMGGGAICLGLTFARLSRLAPATGGPYAYSRMGFGDFAGFLVAWGYWISIWASLPAIAVAFTGSFVKVVPALQGNRMAAIIITLAAMWLVVLTNLRGVKEAGLFAEITTYAKLVPFGAISLLGLAFIRPENLSEFNPSGESLLASSAALAPLTMFAYLGLESATVPAGDVVDPERTIPRSTILGVSVAALLYVLGTTVVLGVVPRAELVKSAAPFADAARIMWGAWAAGIVGVAVMISSLGALNGWTLLMGQVPMAAAGDKLFPPLFGKVSARGVPAVGIVFSAVLATALTLIQAAGGSGFAAFYSLVVNLATMTAVVPYVFCALAVGLVAARSSRGGVVPRVTVVEAIAFVFSLFTIYGCGPDAVLYGFVLLLLGIPVYVWQRRQQSIIVPATN
ncbi:MAG TPA: amino acid permease [Vicinamibacterales bacterium]|nr:amino acid permease [Vicinamibacterales bacterium]